MGAENPIVRASLAVSLGNGSVGLNDEMLLHDWPTTAEQVS